MCTRRDSRPRLSKPSAAAAARSFAQKLRAFADSSTQRSLSAFILIVLFRNLIVPLACTHEIPENLEVPAPVVFCRRRAGLHHRECRQRCQRHLDVFAGRRAVRLHAPVDDDPNYHRPDRSAGDVRPHGSGHGQRPERSHPRRIWPADHLPHDARHSDYKFRKRRRRVCRHCGKHGTVRGLKVLSPFRSVP